MTTTDKQLLDELNELNLSLDEFNKLRQIDISLDDIRHLHTTVLWNAIQKKLTQRKAKAMVLYNSLMALKAKNMPAPQMIKLQTRWPQLGLATNHYIQMSKKNVSRLNWV